MEVTINVKIVGDEIDKTIVEENIHWMEDAIVEGFIEDLNIDCKVNMSIKE